MPVRETLERDVIVVIRMAVGVIVMLGALAGLYHRDGRVAVALAVIFMLGVLHLVIEYKQGGDDDAAAA